MTTENIILMQNAKNSLKGKWGLAIGTCVIYILVTGILTAGKTVGSIVSLIISGPFALGLAIFSISIARNEEANVGQIFLGFSDFGRTLEAYLRILVNIIVKLLLLIVPGIIAALSYSMTFYILADDNAISAKDAIIKSKHMMDGNKLKLFYLGLRFFGLALLCILTLGIGFLWLFPYMNVTMVKFYDDIKYIFYQG